MKLVKCLLLVAFSYSHFNVLSQVISVPLRYDFGPGKTELGFTQVLPETAYSKERGYGFWPGGELTGVDRMKGSALKSDFITSDKPFYFSVNLPDGNYDVIVTYGDKEGTSSQTVRAESRRFMLQNISSKAKKVDKRKFTVHMHTLGIGGSDKKVLITPREVNFFHWDNQLTLEFNGTEPKICGIEIKRNDEAITVFLTGNSTVVDQDKEPWAAWGQMPAITYL